MIKRIDNMFKGGEGMEDGVMKLIDNSGLEVVLKIEEEGEKMWWGRNDDFRLMEFVKGLDWSDGSNYEIVISRKERIK